MASLSIPTIWYWTSPTEFFFFETMTKGKDVPTSDVEGTTMSPTPEGVVRNSGTVGVLVGAIVWRCVTIGVVTKCIMGIFFLNKYGGAVFLGLLVVVGVVVVPGLAVEGVDGSSNTTNSL